MNTGKICVSVCAQTADEMIANIGRAQEFADLVEVRFDCLHRDELKKCVLDISNSKFEKPFLFAFRPKDMGGNRSLTIRERLKFWEHLFAILNSGFMIDVEFDPKVLPAVDPPDIERIVSMHYFNGAPRDLDPICQAISTMSGSIAKIAVHTEDITDGISVWKLLDLAKAKGEKVIPIAMGEAGKWTRILGLAHGAHMTYASLGAGLETAEGQLTAKDLADIYRVKHLDDRTKVYGLIGDPVSASLSPYMHNPAFASAGENAVFIHLQVKDLDGFIRRMVDPATREIELNFGGFSVTMPHKQAILKYLDRLDDDVRKIGAANTVAVEDGRMTGFNTDAHGFITPLLREFGNLGGARVAVFGAGGAARACVFALKKNGALVTVYARNPEKAKNFSRELGVDVEPLVNVIPDQRDIIVNATPLGMKGARENESLFSADRLKGVKLVYDLVTKPTDTPLIREAKEAGIPAIGGLEMLIAQGTKQFEIWTGKKPPFGILRESLLERMQ